MDTKMKILLFDQDLQHYRKPIYIRFNSWLAEFGYELVVRCDHELNPISEGIFQSMNFSLGSFQDEIENLKPSVIIQFVWLRYKFLFPFMLWCKWKRIPVIVWSHGINLQRRKQYLKNSFYYLRQLLADALIIYTPNEKKYIVGNRKKLFIANNTLDFDSFPEIDSKSIEAKNHLVAGKKVILSVGRFNVNNRNIEDLVTLSENIKEEFLIVVIGPGITEEESERIRNSKNMKYLGSIFEQKEICEWYYLARIFVMPGAIGLAINQAFWFNTPVLLKNVDHGPEAFYLQNGSNGFLYDLAGDLPQLIHQIELDYHKFSSNAKNTISNEGSLSKMFDGFDSAIKYVGKR